MNNKLPTYIQKGFVTLLRDLALSGLSNNEYVILTTSPSQWVTNNYLDKITIIDASKLFGFSMWITEQDIQNDIYEKLKRFGINDNQIKNQYRLKSDNSNKIADMVILSDEGNVQILIEIKPTGRDISFVIDQVKNQASANNIPYFLITNGNQFIIGDIKNNDIQNIKDIPSPSKFGINIENKIKSNIKNTDFIIKPNDIPELITILNKFKGRLFIIDYTFPLGDFRSNTLLELSRYIPSNINYPRLDSLTAMLVITSANASPNRLVSMVPPSVLFTSNTVLRSYLRNTIGLAGVIDLPKQLFMPFMGISLPIIILGDYPVSHAHKTAFIQVINKSDLIDTQAQEWYKDLMVGLSNKPMKIGFINEVKDDDIWTLNAHNPEITNYENNLRNTITCKNLEEICDIFTGFPIARNEDENNNGIQVIRGRDLSSSQLSKDQLSSFKDDRNIPERFKIQTGDILLQRISLNPKSILVSPELEGVIASDTVIVIRPKDTIIDINYISQFFASQLGQKLLVSRVKGNFAPTISLTSLKTLPIPLLAENVINDLESVQKIEEDLRNKAEKLESSRINLFNIKSPEELENRLNEIRLSANTISSSIQQSDTLEFKIRNFYPYPIAFPYRSLDSIISVQESYKEHLRVTENILAFLGSIILSLIEDKDKINSKINLKEAFGRGISPGTWNEISKQGTKILKNYKDNQLAQFLSSLYLDNKNIKFQESILNLIRTKNDFKHDRGPTVDEEYKIELHKVKENLSIIVKELAFFTDYPIRQVSDIDVLRGTSKVLIHTLRLVGDHPSLPQEKCEYKEALTKNDLFIQLEEINWSDLYPYITVQYCPSCKHKEIYFIDKWKENNKLLLKSFERGHVIEPQEENLVAILNKWNLPI